MNPRKYMKYFSIISLFSLISVAIVFGFIQNITFAVFISLLADSIQIVGYVAWLLQKEVSLEQVPKQVEVIYKYVAKKEKRNKLKEELISRLVNEGAIRDIELYSLVRDKEIILAFTYGERVKKRILDLCGLKSQPLATLLKRCGFVRATSRQNLMVAFADSLPKNLRNIDEIDNFIRRELPKMWEQISNKIKEKYPPDRYKIYEKWRTLEGFTCMYILSKSFARDFIINYIKKESFRPEFKKLVWGTIDRKKLREIIRKRRYKVKKIISKISIDFLLRDLPKNVRKTIVEHEDYIKKALGIEVFTDYRLIEQNRINDVLLDFLPENERKNVNQYSEAIINESKDCYNLLRELGIYF